MKEQYYTFFLVSYENTEEYDSLILFINWILQKLEMFEKAEISYVRKWRKEELPNKLSKDVWKEFNELVNDNQIEEFFIQTQSAKSDCLDFHLYARIASMRPLPYYYTYIDPTLPEWIEYPSGLKIISLSIEKRLFQTIFLQNNEINVLNKYIEQMFICFKCVYAYGDYTNFTINSPFELISNCDEPRRLCDFDYTHHIEDVFEYNILSNKHIEILGRNIDDILSIHNVTSEILYDNTSKTSRTIILNRLSTDKEESIRELFEPLLKQDNKEGIDSHHCLLNRYQTSKIESYQSIEKMFCSQSKLFPYDYVEIIRRKQIKPSDSLEAVVKDRILYKSIYPEIIFRNIYIHEYMESFRGLINKNASYTRVPYNEKLNDNEEFVVVWFEDIIDLFNLEITLLLRERLVHAKIKHIDLMFHEWINLIKSNSDEYGELDIITKPNYGKVNNKTSFTTMIDGHNLKQEAINLLILMIDDYNSNDYVIKFIIFGNTGLEKLPVSQ